MTVRIALLFAASRDRLSVHPTLRSLEQALGVSRTTISRALRGSPYVRESTAARIRKAAAAAGYERNPLAGAVMSELRRSRGELFRGVLALLDLDERDRPKYAGRFHAELALGAEERAETLGFKIERFMVGPRMPQRRVNQILQSRDIQGVLLLPTWGSPDYLNLDWSKYSGIYMDYRIERPAISCVCCDHFRSMMMALEELVARGYRRPGLILPRQHDARLQHRWAAAFLAFQKLHLEEKAVPPLITDPVTEENFAPWFRVHQPDVVLGHVDLTIDWMRRAGARVPETTGFFCLNLMNATRPCAGLDQRPRQIGWKAAEIVIASLQHNEHGIPPAYSLTSQPAAWVDGPTIRARAA